MLIVSVSGGLGNQMFQYAFACSLLRYCKDVKLDISKYDYYKVHNNYELEKIFNIKASYASIQEKRKLGYRRDNRLTNIIINSPIAKKSVFNEGEDIYDLRKLPHDDTYFRGYWQNESYFSDIREKIIEIYRFPEMLDDANISFREKIKSGISVSLHVRRGDYLNHPLYRGICDIAYYKSAYEYLEKKIGEEFNLFVFSNDIEWVEENMHFPNMCVVDVNHGENSFRDMQLMALCNHNIVANSSFSWWGAWLNQNKGKIVIAPRKWVNAKTPIATGVAPESWVKI